MLEPHEEQCESCTRALEALRRTLAFGLISLAAWGRGSWLLGLRQNSLCLLLWCMSISCRTSLGASGGELRSRTHSAAARRTGPAFATKPSQRPMSLSACCRLIKPRLGHMLRHKVTQIRGIFAIDLFQSQAAVCLPKSIRKTDCVARAAFCLRRFSSSRSCASLLSLASAPDCISSRHLLSKSVFSSCERGGRG